MTKKICKILIIAIIAFCAFSLLNSVQAKQYTSIDELGKEILAVNPNAQSAYVIGNYAFTSAHQLTTEDVMLAARSINVVDVNGKTSADNIYKEMTIYSVWANFDNTGKITSWSIKNNVVGETDWNIDEMDIIYIDYNQTVTVTFDYGYDNKIETNPIIMGTKIAKPVDPARTGYVFKGWYNGDTEYNFDTPVNNNITLVAKWALDVDAIVANTVGDINPQKYLVKSNGNEITVTVKIDAIDSAITIGGSGVVDGLYEALENADVANIIITAENNNSLSLNTNNKDITTIKAWIEGLFPGVEIDQITNGDFADKTYTIKVTLRDGILSTNGNSEETYTINIKSQKEINVDDIVNDSIAQINQNKYDVELNRTNEDAVVTVTIPCEVRDELITAGESNIVNTLKSVLDDEDVDSITLGVGENKIEINKNTSVSAVKSWIENYLGKNITQITHNDFENKGFSVKVNLGDGAVTEEHEKTEAYAVEFVLEAYKEVNVNNLIKSVEEEINSNTNSLYTVKLDTETIVIKDTADITFELLTALHEKVNVTGVKSIEIAGTGIVDGKKTIYTSDNNIDYGTIVEITNNSQLIGKTYTIKVNVDNGYIDTSAKNTYTVKFVKEADVSTTQTSAINVINDNTTFHVEIKDDNKIEVKVNNVQDDMWALSGSGVRTSLGKFLDNDEVASVTISIKENGTTASNVTVTKENLNDTDTLKSIAKSFGVTDETTLGEVVDQFGSKTIMVDIAPATGFTIPSGYEQYKLVLKK